MDNSPTTLRGRIISNPQYIMQEIDEYCDNPCIEALPAIFADEDIIQGISNYPKYEEIEKEKPGKIRQHLLRRLKTFVQPLDIHFKVESMFSILIRRGYIARNISSKEYLQRLQRIADVKGEIDKKAASFTIELSETVRSTAGSATIIGDSGIGKTTAVEKTLLMYPQVILHTEYKDKPLTRTQIVWLKLDCPYDGNMKTLCRMFFKAVDDVLETTSYYKKFGEAKVPTATMMFHMTYIACLHSIGVLVIDEIQHLINRKNNPDEMLNFFVTMVNTIGIPTVLIGTPKALEFINKGLRQIRRAEDAGSIIWSRMKKDYEWDFFLDSMWTYQWTRKYTPLTNELNNAIYEETQGIAFFAVNLFILAQATAIENGSEMLTVGLVKEVARRDMKLSRRLINGIRECDIDAIKEYEDVFFDIEGMLTRKQQKMKHRERTIELAEERQQAIKTKEIEIIEALTQDFKVSNTFNHLTFDEIASAVQGAVKEFGVTDDIESIKSRALKRALDAEEKIKETTKKKNSKNQSIPLKEQDLRKLFKDASNNNYDIYEVLKNANYIKDPLKEFF